MTDPYAASQSVASDQAQPTANTTEGLEEVIETLVNGIRGYRAAAEAAEDTGLAEFLSKKADERRRHLDAVVRTAADEVVVPEFGADGTVPGSLHRSWLELKGSVAGDDAVISSVISGEKHALEDIDEALAESGLPEPVKNALREASDSIRNSLKELESRAS